MFDTRLWEIAPVEPSTNWLNVVIETTRGSPNKYKYDLDLHTFRLDKILPLGAFFPYDFGFIPGTLGEDGDPLDVLVIMNAPAFTGCLLHAVLIGVIEAEQTEAGETLRNDRLLGSVVSRRNVAEFTSLEQLGHRLDELEHFFVSYNIAEGREFKPIGRHGPEVARRLIDEGARRFHAELVAGGTAVARRNGQQDNLIG